MAGSLAYINTSLESFEAAGVQRKLIHIQEDIVATIVLDFSTIFESVNARLDQERVKEQDVAGLYLVLE
jgi:hypothetical protein